LLCKTTTKEVAKQPQEVGLETNKHGKNNARSSFKTTEKIETTCNN
jgi:hypothetical protein